MASAEGGMDGACSSSGSSMKGSPEKIPKHSPHRDLLESRVILPDPSSIGQDSDCMDLDQANDNVISEDNVSLEVNLGDGSCRASDVSSLSFQNAVLDDMELDKLSDKYEGEIQERGQSIQDSDSDSCQNEESYMDVNQPQFSQETLEAKLSHKPMLESHESRLKQRGDLSKSSSLVDRDDASDRFSQADSQQGASQLSDRSTEGCRSMGDGSGSERALTPSTLPGGENLNNEIYSQDGRSDYDSSSQMEEGDRESLEGAKRGVTPEAKDAIDALINNALEMMDDRAISPSSSSSGPVQWSPTKSREGFETGKPNKRNSLEVRNNIPDVSQVKDYKSDLSLNEIAKLQSKAELVPKMLKQSPGLARRVPDGADARSSSEPESNSDREVTPVLDQQVHGNAQNMQEDKTSTDTPSDGAQDSRETTPKINMDIENEYDYVKTARIQHGDSYVGMRLAYSSSQDSLKQNGVKGLPSSDDDHSLGCSPEKLPHPNRIGYTSQSLGRMNEDSFTEIPLSSVDVTQVEDKRNVSMSPEATECDSAEVESIISDGGPDCGMPMVEDGLSSSQGSDIEDAATLDTNQPAEILKRKRKAEVESELVHKAGIDGQTSENSSPERKNREALDLAIRDIQSAIQQSKTASLKSPQYENEESQPEPVWIMREAYKNRGSEYVDGEEINHETDSSPNHSNSMQTEEVPPNYPYQENLKNGKTYQQHRGHDSEEEGHERRSGRTRWNKGKTYNQVKSQAEDPNVQHVNRERHFQSLLQSRYASEYKDGRMRHGQHLIKPSQYGDDASRAGQVTYHPYKDDPREQPMYKDEHHETLSVYSDNPTSAEVRNYRDSNIQTDFPRANKTDASRFMNSVYEGRPKERSRSESDVPHSIHENGEGSDEGSEGEDTAPNAYIRPHGEGDFDTDEETAELLDKQYLNAAKVDIPELTKPPVNRSVQAEKRKTRAREGEQEEQCKAKLRDPDDETVLIEGVLFRAKYLGSTQLISEGQPSKGMRMMQAQEAVGRIKVPEGENQPGTDVDLFVSTEKIMVLNTDLQEVMMDHSLRSISYIADINDIIVVMARRRLITSPGDEILRRKKQSKILCHVFETDEAQLIAQSIGQAFQVAYMEFLKANGIDDPGLMKEMDYQDVLAQQEIFGEELQLFSSKDKQKEVIVPKMKGEPLGVVVVESGWGSMVPTVVLANMNPQGAAARCGQLNIGDQIISVNGVSLVGLPLSSCQNYIRAVKTQTVVKLTVVSCAPVVEVLIKRPDIKYQLGFSVQNGVICSLLRGGIAERGGVRVGHRIIEINNQSVVAVAHEKIVSMLASSVGEIHMKTMPTSIYRLLTGQDAPHYI